MPGRRSISAEQAKQIGVDRRYFGDISDAVLLTSRGGDRYDVTFQTALLRPGIGAQNWVSRTNYPALGIVPTGKHEMSWYVNQNYGQLTAHVRRYTFRIDGISCATADLEGGELITRPITMKGNRLELNYATSAAGSVSVELQDKDGQPINGFELRTSKPLIGNEIKTTVFWGDNASTTALIGKTIKIRFALSDAELYSFRFAK